LINSPVVRGDNLRFREEGVKEVVSRVLLPWLNSFRFFLGQVALLRNESGVEFKWDPTAERSANVMDRWILARCQTLIKLVHDEMSCRSCFQMNLASGFVLTLELAYRLYTVVPRLLDLIDELTNWYIRFNRRRLKGENGPEDAIAALNSLFEALLTLCRTLVSMRRVLTVSIDFV
jgi:isoleucyl-tRNA synthetase